MSRIRLFLIVGTLTGFILPPAQGATDEQLEQFKAQINAEIGAVKKDYEGRIKALEERINTLEADNTQLRGQAAATPKPAGEDVAALKQRIAELEQARSERRDEYSGTSQELASMKQRLSQLEGVASKAQTEMPAVTEREAANTAAIEEIDRKLRGQCDRNSRHLP